MDNLYETTEATLLRAHQSGIAYWKCNRPNEATEDNIRSLARSLGFHGEHGDMFIAGLFGAKRREHSSL